MPERIQSHRLAHSSLPAVSRKASTLGEKDKETFFLPIPLDKGAILRPRGERGVSPANKNKEFP